jgi:hypothetical protein
LLPSDPALLTLTTLHKSWILANMLDEAERISDVEMPSREGTTVKHFGIDEEEFKLFSKRQRELTEEQKMMEQQNA